MKRTFFNRFLKQNGARSKSHDNVHGGDVKKFYTIERKNLTIQIKY